MPYSLQQLLAHCQLVDRSVLLNVAHGQQAASATAKEAAYDAAMHHYCTASNSPATKSTLVSMFHFCHVQAPAGSPPDVWQHILQEHAANVAAGGEWKWNEAWHIDVDGPVSAMDAMKLMWGL